MITDVLGRVLKDAASVLGDVEVEAGLGERKFTVFWRIHGQYQQQQYQLTQFLIQYYLIFCSQTIFLQKQNSSICLHRSSTQHNINMVIEIFSICSYSSIFNISAFQDITHFSEGLHSQQRVSLIKMSFSFVFEICYNIISESWMTLFVIALVVTWVFLSILALKMNLNTFKRMEKLRPLEEADSKFLGLVRTDYHQWNRKLILVGSCVFFPMKFLLLANFLSGAFIFALFISIAPRSIAATLEKMMFMYFNSYGKLMTSLAMNTKEFFPSSSIKTPIVICNHQCWFDTFYITLRNAPLSYVAKYEIQFWPVIGPIAKAMNCIFVKRDSKDAREETMRLIKQRVDDFYANKEGAYPLVIFCEGTTSDNNVLLKFKRGAFENLSAVTAFTLKYECDNFVMGEDQLTQAEHIFTALAQRPTLGVKKMEIHPYQGEEVENYMERCRELMAKTWDFKLSDAGYRQVKALGEVRKAQRQKTD